MSPSCQGAVHICSTIIVQRSDYSPFCRNFNFSYKSSRFIETSPMTTSLWPVRLLRRWMKSGNKSALKSTNQQPGCVHVNLLPQFEIKQRRYTYKYLFRIMFLLCLLHCGDALEEKKETWKINIGSDFSGVNMLNWTWRTLTSVK